MTSFWASRHVLVTGHTGFKGAWLCLWLEKLGAKVSAFGLPPDTTPALCNLVGSKSSAARATVDLNDAAAVARTIAEAQPEIVIHLAAQALVRHGYKSPTKTFATNVMGTLNVLSALRECRGIKAVVVVTTDKVYENGEHRKAFVEGDRLGGKDPYSASKACVEILSQSFRDSFFTNGPAMATARAGNVVGGGDWSHDRLVPDIIRALDANEPVRLRYPNAVRPWQHVLEPLAGYLALAQSLVERPKTMPWAINFGPHPANFAPVHRVVDALGQAFGMVKPWQPGPGLHPPEAAFLTLQSGLAEATLAWRSRLSLDDTLLWTANWYAAHRDGRDMRAYTLAQITAYESLTT